MFFISAGSLADVDQKWIKLLHYEKNLMGKMHSRIEDQKFFLHPQGQKNPNKELLANIESLQQNPHHYHCRFPARYEYLTKKLNLARTPPCQELSFWKSQFKPKGVSLIYASQYLSNPTSVMGHTFLRFSNQESSEYLNVTVNYGADIPEDAGVMDYLVKGIFGGFKGTFFVGPFYIKHHEYINIDRRDLWEYELNLASEEINDLINHLWELVKQVEFKYYFTRENCAFLPLAALEAVKPDLKIIDQLHFYLIPSESLKAIRNQGLVKSVKFYPSLRKKLEVKLEQMNVKQRNSYDQILSDADQKFQSEDNLVLEAVMDYYHIQKQLQGGRFYSDQEAFFNRALMLRSRLGVNTNEPALRVPTAPDRGHGPFRVGIGTGLQNRDTSFVELDFRPALHELFDIHTGYLPYSEISLLKGQTRFYLDSSEFVLDSLTIFSLKKIVPYSSISSEISWAHEFLLESNKYEDCRSCYFVNFNSHIGLAAGSLFKTLNFYALPGVDLKWGNLSNRLSAGLGSIFGVIYSPWENFKLLADLGVHYGLRPSRQSSWDFKGSFDASYSLSSDYSLVLKTEFLKSHFSTGRELCLSGHYYF